LCGKREQTKREGKYWMKLWVKILIGFVLGAIVGLIVGPSIAVIKPLGDLFIRLIKMLIVPMVFVRW